MKPQSRSELLFRLFRAAAAEQPESLDEHVARDDELLTCWTLGLLPQGRVEKLLKHLSLCPACRREVVQLICRGVLVFSEEKGHDLETESAQDPSRIPSLAGWFRPGRWWLVGLTAAAASLLIALGWFLAGRGPEAELARAEKELLSGQTQAGFKRVKQLLAGNLTAEAREQARQLLERTGYTLARQELEAGSFDRVQEILQVISAEESVTPRLVNLGLQAERRIPAEIALAQAGALVDYGYLLDGTTTKALPVLDRTQEKLDRELQEAVTASPQDLALLLNRGQFLLVLCRFEQAREQFTMALSQDGENLEAHLGLGMARFELKQYQAALDQFQAVIRLDPDRAAGFINAAMCLQQLQKPAEALPLWKRAQGLTKNPVLHQQIETHLARISGGH